ncbi:MAG TPA: methionine adenosyltransferase [Alphaproteobacteria bacterium]|nr:methionine adenosyltransferase [Rhodospirillaceae bacterium]HRJ12417.1 methionine adenosyltransferase [Alphaproteobacteria bacterium]
MAHAATAAAITPQSETGKKSFVFTSESVSEGHPDKICDRVSDSILDALLTQDPEARAGVECFATTNLLVIGGEIRVKGGFEKKHMEEIARAAIKDIGYDQDGFSHSRSRVDVVVHEQSADIAQGVDNAADSNASEGAGDQGIMFGYACDETPEYMPAPLLYSHQILKSLAEARHSGAAPELGPDSKSQVTLQYKDGRPVGVTSVLVSTQHADGVTQERVREIVRPHVENVLPNGWMPPEETFYVNPTGRFVIGGPDGDAGLTGRKIIVDTYGGAAPHGGGAFSGKDPTKVDRSAAYAARYLAKNVVAAGLARRCTIQLSYAIGIAKPLSVFVNTHGNSEVDHHALSKALQEMMDLSPRGIRTHLKLNRPIYARTSAYGHFGRAPEADGGFSWENLDLVEKLKAKFGA